MQITTKIFLEKLFPQDDCYWRVDWVDGLINKLQEREPQLRVFLTKIKSGLKGAINPISPYSIDKSAKSHATIIIGVGHQNIVYIGSVWHQGRDVSNKFQYEKFNLVLDISGIESFWSYAKGRHAKFNGVLKHMFFLQWKLQTS